MFFTAATPGPPFSGKILTRFSSTTRAIEGRYGAGRAGRCHRKMGLASAFVGKQKLWFELATPKISRQPRIRTVDAPGSGSGARCPEPAASLCTHDRQPIPPASRAGEVGGHESLRNRPGGDEDRGGGSRFRKACPRRLPAAGAHRGRPRI